MNLWIATLLDVLYRGPMGEVLSENVTDSLGLLLKGMAGIFVVMLLIFLVIVILSKISEKKTGKPTDKKDDGPHKQP